MEKMIDLRDLLRHEIMDLYSAEEQIIEAMPAMIENAQNPTLTKLLRDHLKVTEGHLERLKRVQEMMGEVTEESESGENKGLFSRLFGGGGSGSQKCRGMEGLITEGQKVMAEDMNTEVKDAAIIAAAQRIEHYEICGYGTARAYARELMLEDIAMLLEETLNEEYEADDLLTQLALGRINEEARTGENRGRGGSSGNRAGSSSKGASKSSGSGRGGSSSGGRGGSSGGGSKSSSKGASKSSGGGRGSSSGGGSKSSGGGSKSSSKGASKSSGGGRGGSSGGGSKNSSGGSKSSSKGASKSSGGGRGGSSGGGSKGSGGGRGGSSKGASKSSGGGRAGSSGGGSKSSSKGASKSSGGSRGGSKGSKGTRGRGR